MNIVDKTIEEFEQIIATGLVDANLFTSDINTLKMIQKNCLLNNNLASTKLLARQLTKPSAETKSQIEAYIDQIKNTSNSNQSTEQSPQLTTNNEASNGEQTVPNDKNQLQSDIALQEQSIAHESIQHGNTPTSSEIMNIVFGLSNQIGQFQKFLSNINDKNTDTYIRTLENVSIIQNTFKEIEVFINDVRQSESRILNAQTAIHEDVKSITENVTSALVSDEVIRSAKIRRQELENTINEAKAKIEADIEIIYEKTKRNADIIALEIVEQAQQKATMANKEYIAEVNAKNQEIIDAANKKNTNLLLFGLIFTFIINLFVAGFVAKLVANYSSSSTTEYISKIISDAQQNKQAIANKQLRK